MLFGLSYILAQDDFIQKDIELLEHSGIKNDNDGLLTLEKYEFYQVEKDKESHSIPTSIYDEDAYINESRKYIIDEITSNILSGKDSMDGVTGLIERAYISSVDQSLDSYILYIPKDYSKEKSYPLVVFLHGSGEKTFLPESSPSHKMFIELCDKYKFIMVAPNGRNHPDFKSSKKNFGASVYMNDGEQDVLQVISQVEKIYKIDLSKVYLTGYSMGGFGTWYLGSRHPDMFAAIAPVCGFGTGKNGSRFKCPPVDIDKLKNMPVYAVHGDKDTRVLVSESRELVSALIRDGDKEVYYGELIGVSHNAWDFVYDDEKLFKWFSRYSKKFGTSIKLDTASTL